MTLFAITNNPDEPTAGLYATVDSDGATTVQLFVSEDDAISYNTQLEAIGQDLHVSEISDSNNIDKLCGVLGFAFTIIQPGEVVVPRYETRASDFQFYLDNLK